LGLENESSVRAELFAETAARMGVGDAIVEKDYEKMGVMIFDKQPPFGWVLERLNALERDINS